MTEVSLAHVAWRVTDTQSLLLLMDPDHEGTPRFKVIMSFAPVWSIRSDLRLWLGYCLTGACDWRNDCYGQCD